MSFIEEMDIFGSFLTYSRVGTKDSLIFVTKSFKKQTCDKFSGIFLGKDSMKGRGKHC